MAGDTAFSSQPTLGNNIEARMPGSGFTLQGQFFIGTFENRGFSTILPGRTQGDGPTGRLTSDAFTLSRPFITFLIGGTNDSARVRVELLVRMDPGDTRFPLLARERLWDGHDYIIGAFATGRNAEAMRREHTDAALYSGRMVRIRIVDNSPSGHINVDDIQVADSVTTRIRVTNPRSEPVKAEVFVNGVLRGQTSPEGILITSPRLAVGDLIVARQRLAENRTLRGDHNQGSAQHWRYRTYITSMAVNDDGSTSPFPVVDPAATQELRVDPNNVLFGIHLVVSVEYDATSSDIATIRAQMTNGSAFLYNATDGQFLFEQIEIATNRGMWVHADYKIYADNNLRAHANTPFGFYDPGIYTPGAVHFGRSIWDAGQVYAHEFGHYGLGLFDEYFDSSTNMCTQHARASTGDFRSGAPQASCMMWQQTSAPKICSDHPLNPHSVSTLQGLVHFSSCWTQILEAWRRPVNMIGADAGYQIKTPETRRAIPGMLPPMPSGWQPRFNVSAALRPGLLPPFVKTYPFFNMPSYVFLETGGYTMLQGVTNPSNGQILIVGAHVGDIIRVRGTQETLTMADALTSDSFLPADMNHFEPFAGIQQKGQKLEDILKDKLKDLVKDRLQNLAPHLQIEAMPAGEGVALIRVRTTAGKLAKEPRVVYDRDGKDQAVDGKFDPKTQVFEGLVQGLPKNYSLALSANGASAEGITTVGYGRTRVMPLIAKMHEIYTPDGRFAVTLPPKGLPLEEVVTAGTSADAVKLNPGMVVVSGPYRFSTAQARQAPDTYVRFLMTPAKEQRPWYDDKSLRIMQLMPDGSWKELATRTHLAALDIVSAAADTAGSFVLVARSVGK